MERQVAERCRRLEEGRVKLAGKRGCDLIGDERLVVGLRPVGAVEFLLGPLLKRHELAILLEHPLELGDLEVLRVARPLQRLQVEDSGDILHRGTGEHFAGKIEEDHGRVVDVGDGVKHRPRRVGMQPIPQEPQKGLAANLHVPIEGKSQILGEGAFPGAVEARHPHADLVAAASLLRSLHLPEQVLEAPLDVVGDHVLGDLGLQLLVGAIGVGDDLLDRAGERAAGIEEVANGGHGCRLERVQSMCSER